MTTSSDRYSGETGRTRIDGVINYLLELQGEVDNDERQHIEIMIADLRHAVMCVRAAEYRAGCAIEQRDEARRIVCKLEAEIYGHFGDEWRLVVNRASFMPSDAARERGWDCFKEATDDR